MAKRKSEPANNGHVGGPVVVAIGASAGGVGALQRFFANIPDRTGAAYARLLQVVDHELSALPFTEPRGQRSPIDHLFRSLAERLGDGFAVILSGAGSDGALGVRAVKEAGGIILVQEPAESEYPSMPRSAIASGIADVVLPVADLAARLGDLIRLKHSNGGGIPKVDEELLRRVLAHRDRTRTPGSEAADRACRPPP